MDLPFRSTVWLPIDLRRGDFVKAGTNCACVCKLMLKNKSMEN